MNRIELAQAIFQVSHLTGEFKLRSGQTSTEYFDKYRFEARPALLKEIAIQMKELLPKDTEVLAGLDMGGIPLATALSLETGLPICFVRKEAKDYGTCQFAEGEDVQGKKVAVIEDVVTTGGQALLSAQELSSAGANVVSVLCVIFRGENDAKFKEMGLTLRPLFTMDELKNA